MTQSQQSTTGQIVIGVPEDPSNPLVVNPASNAKAADLTEDEARVLTREIKRTTIRLWVLVTEAHDRKAAAALGYATWDDYVRGELQMSPARAYQLLDTGHVMRELAAAGTDVEAIEPPPARVVARIKDRLSDVRKAATSAVKKGEPVDAALRELAREPRRTAAPAATPSGEGEGEEPVGRGQGPVKCPACLGEGKVNRSMAPALRKFMKERFSGDDES